MVLDVIIALAIYESIKFLLILFVEFVWGIGSLKGYSEGINKNIKGDS